MKSLQIGDWCADGGQEMGEGSRIRTDFLKTLAITSVLLVPAVYSAAEQSAAASSQSEPGPVYQEEIHVRIVTLPVLARDRRGDPVTDLRLDEISVREGRENHHVESLTRVFPETITRDTIPSGRLITPLEDDRYEVTPVRGAEPHYMMILLDLENDSPLLRQRSTSALRQFVANDLDPAYRLAVMSFDRGLRLLVPFTDDRQKIGTAIADAYSNPGAQRSPPSGARIRQLLQRLTMCELDGLVDSLCVESAMREHVAEHVPPATAFLDALGGAVDYMKTLDGPKSILTVGGSIPFSPALDATDAAVALYGDAGDLRSVGASLELDGSARAQLEELLLLAYSHGTTLNFIDTTPSPSALSARLDRLLRPGSRPLLNSFQRAQQDLQDLAISTGGSFVGSTNLEEALDSAVAWMRGTYYLSFYLDDDQPLTPARLRRMKVQSLRPGVRVEYRRSFDGWRGALVNRAPEHSIRGALDAEPPVRTILEGEVLDLVPLRLEFDPRDLTYEERGEEASTRFSVTLRIRDSEGGLLAESFRHVGHSYPLELWQNGDVEPPSMLTFVDLPVGDYTAEAIITASDSQSRGTLRRQFSIADREQEEHLIVDPGRVEPAITERDASKEDEISIPVKASVSSDRAPRQAGVEPMLAEGVTPPAVTFVRKFLGIISGTVEVSVLTSARTQRVEIQLDGRRVGLIDGAPWSVEVDLGDLPEPRHLVAIAYDREGTPIGVAVQRLNLPRSMAEVDVVISENPAGGLVGHLTYDSVEGERPQHMSARLNGAPLPVTESLAIAIPKLDMQSVHVLRIEAHFESAGTVTTEVPFGGRYGDQVLTRLSPAAIRLDGGAEPELEDLRAAADGIAVQPVAIDKGEADLIVVVDPAAMRVLPRILSTIRPGYVTQVRSPEVTDIRATPAESGVYISLLWPSAMSTDPGDRERLGYRLFPSTSPDDATPGRGLVWHLASAAFPEITGSERLADAVATAGPMAVARSRRRAVLLLYGGSTDESTLGARAARHYLAQLGVPLVVWSLARPDDSFLEQWGEVEAITHLESVRRSWTALMRDLDRQRIVWLDGDHLPQNIEITGPGISPLR